MNTSIRDYNTFEELYANNYKPLLAFISRRIDDTSEAEDIVQDTFIRALQASYTPIEGKHPLAWLCTIASRLIIDRHRHNTRMYAPTYVAIGDDNESFTLTDPTEFEQVIEDRETINSTLAKMPTHYQRAIILHAAIGYTFEKSAEHEHISPKAMKTRYWRAIEMFRIIYKEKAS